MLEDLNADRLDALLDEATVPLLVDFWAPWCGPCRMQQPILEKLAGSDPASFRIAKLNVDDHPDVARRFGVTAMPTLIVFRDGEPVQRFIGVQREPALAAALSAA